MLTAIILAGALGALQSAPAGSQSAPSSKTKGRSERTGHDERVRQPQRLVEQGVHVHHNSSGFQHRLSGKDVSKCSGNPCRSSALWTTAACG
jgi:hypothetical protein